MEKDLDKKLERSGIFARINALGAIKIVGLIFLLTTLLFELPFFCTDGVLTFRFTINDLKEYDESIVFWSYTPLLFLIVDLFMPTQKHFGKNVSPYFIMATICVVLGLVSLIGLYIQGSGIEVNFLDFNITNIAQQKNIISTFDAVGGESVSHKQRLNVDIGYILIFLGIVISIMCDITIALLALDAKKAVDKELGNSNNDKIKDGLS